MTQTFAFSDSDYDVLRQYREAEILQPYGMNISIIDADDEYFNSESQIKKLKNNYHADKSEPKKLELKDAISNIFSNIPKYKKSKKVVTTRINAGPDLGWEWPTNKQILPNVYEETIEENINKFRQGIEIRTVNQFVAGLVKISAGTPGHIVKPTNFGVNDLNLNSENSFTEIDLFNPIYFIQLQAENKPIERLVTFPIVTSDANQAENYIFNGIIEPFPIRPVLAFFSINTPFEPRSFKGQVGNGNLNTRFASDQVLTVDVFDRDRKNDSYYLDAIDPVSMRNDEGTQTVYLGPSIGYFNIDENMLGPFNDKEQPSNLVDEESFDNDLIKVIKQLKPGGTSYISRKEKSATTGFIYDNLGPAGVDSIAYGGMIY